MSSFQYYTSRSHTHYISQKYNRETIESSLDSFSSSDNARSSDGLPLIIEIKHKTAQSEENDDRFTDDDVSRMYSVAPQPDDKVIASDDYSIINNHIHQTKDENFISRTNNLSDKPVLIEAIGNNSHKSLDKDENSKLKRKVSPICQVEDEDNISYDNEHISKPQPNEDNISYGNELMSKVEPINQIEYYANKRMNKISLSFDDGDLNNQRTGIFYDIKQSDYVLNTMSKELHGQLCIVDASTVDLSSQQSTWSGDQSYSVNSKSETDLKSLTDKYLDCQLSTSLTQLISLTQLSTSMAAHDVELNMFERRTEKRFQMPPYLEMMSEI